ncbi:hypothetical protein D3C81_1478490 [compost metagenome]
MELLFRIRIQISVLLAKLTLDLPFLDCLGHPTQCFLIGFEIQFCAFLTEVVDQLVVDKTVLSRDFCRRIPGRAIQDFAGLQDGDFYAGLY